MIPVKIFSSRKRCFFVRFDNLFALIFDKGNEMVTLVNGLNCIEGDTAVAIGKFDGLHIGHDTILKKLTELKKRGFKTVLLSFDPSPDVFFWRMEDSEILSRTETEERLLQYGIDYHLVLSFTTELAQMTPEDFLSEILVSKLHARHLVAGEDVSFGYKGRGNAEFLKQKEKAGVIACHILKKQKVDGIEVSSTRIRELIKEGNIRKANEMLGYRYSFTGIIEEGKHLGRTYGIPTVNFYPEKKKILPPKGVYFTRAHIRGEKYFAMTNIGLRPSVEETKNSDGKKGINLESYLFGNPGELYGEVCTIELCYFHRPEKHFDSLELLVEQLRTDKEICSEYFGLNG